MRKKEVAKAKKELERRFGKLHESLTGYHDHIDFRSLDDFDDNAFAWLMQNVKGVNMLDLNETDNMISIIMPLDLLEIWPRSIESGTNEFVYAVSDSMIINITSYNNGPNHVVHALKHRLTINQLFPT
jgi:hypothetical protein